MKTVVATVGRFQTPYLHAGHVELLSKCFAMAEEKVVIFVGVSSMNNTEKNPLQFPVIRDMLMEECMYKGYNSSCEVVISPLKDVPFSDKLWSDNLDHELIEDAGHVLLIGGRDSFLQYYKGFSPTLEIPEVGKGGTSATEVRKGVTRPDAFSGVLQGQRFREGIIYAHNSRKYPIVYPVVDIVVWKVEDGKVLFLLGKKHGEENWRIPGGFVDAGDRLLESAAVREFQEECGEGMTFEKPVYVMSKSIDDRRFKGVKDSIMSTCFSIRVTEGEAVAGDDLGTVAWADIMEINEVNMIREHKVFIDKFNETHRR
jgi:bifunctional NMN adenylyltransferase/nudix hydrolase